MSEFRSKILRDIETAVIGVKNSVGEVKNHVETVKNTVNEIDFTLVSGFIGSTSDITINPNKTVDIISFTGKGEVHGLMVAGMGGVVQLDIYIYIDNVLSYKSLLYRADVNGLQTIGSITFPQIFKFNSSFLVQIKERRSAQAFANYAVGYKAVN